MKTTYKTLSGALTFFTFGALLVAPALRAAEQPDSQDVSKMLADARTEAFELKMDAQTLEGYSRTNASWQTQSSLLSQMKEHVNAAGKTLAKLEVAKNSASPWQATAIDRIRPMLKEMAANTETVIKYLTDNREKIAMPAYKDYVEASSDVADRLSALISDFVDYGNTKNRLEKLAIKLELPTT